jgi:uncharacterized protein YhfF
MYMASAHDIDWRLLPRFSFGDSAALADELAALVLSGEKCATCWAAGDSANLTNVGQRWVMRDGSGVPKAILETIEVTRKRFDEIDAAFAFDEGEGDETLASWRAAHRDYFERQGTFSEDMLLDCERFRLIERIAAG